MKKYFLYIALVLFTLSAAGQETFSKLYPGLFDAVQTSSIFPDNKTFVDARPKAATAVIMHRYNEQKDKPKFVLKDFVLENFTMPAVSNGAFITDINEGIRKHIDTLWNVLQRKPDTSANSSLIPLPYPYIVPGGRFREIYYWDSYFTMLGLQQSHQIQIIQNMINNFAYLIDHYGFIPNGNRTYYLTRSQPPFFCMMVELLARQNGNKIYKQYQPQLLKEYAFWMKGASELKPGEANNMVVRMRSKEVLNRYADAGNEPRDESYVKDVNAAKLSTQQPADFYKNVRSAAESGWDFSSRWFGPDKQLTSIQTINIIPVDLNCLLYKLELTIAHTYLIDGNLTKYNEYQLKAISRKNAILKYCWDNKTGWFYDYNWNLVKRSNIKTLAGTFPLEFEVCSALQAKKVAKNLKLNFLKPGGLVTTLNKTGQQWDAPNGWAPLQYIAVDGLSKYGQKALAKDIAERWVKLNISVFKQTGKLLEKYNVEDIDLKAGGGEYPLQDGFGWTNGVLLTLMNRYHIDDGSKVIFMPKL